MRPALCSSPSLRAAALRLLSPRDVIPVDPRKLPSTSRAVAESFSPRPYFIAREPAPLGNTRADERQDGDGPDNGTRMEVSEC